MICSVTVLLPLTRRSALENLPGLRSDQLLFLNIEPDSIHDPDLASDEFIGRIREAEIDPGQVVFEVTEHAVVQDLAAFRDQLARLRQIGYRLALDDVGSGYAGLHSIAEIGPEYLKIDMALVRDLHRHSIKRELISTIRRFTERTGSTMVAEGVEQLQELRALTEMGVRCAQGFLFSVPSETPQAPDWPNLCTTDLAKTGS
jgi:EAL domain-containing protein (putative c-di-GMP-specific phosphodiesterase class I)